MLKAVLSLTLLVLVAGNSFAGEPQGHARSSTNQFIVRLAPDTVGDGRVIPAGRSVPRFKLDDGQELQFVRRFDPDSIIVRLPADVSLEEAGRIAEQLAAEPHVVSATPDKRMYPAFVPTDSEYFRQWHLFEPVAGIAMPEAWDLQTGSSAIVIAVLDSGILPHADLDPTRVLAGYDFISDLDTANDGDGRDADPSDPGDASTFDECEPLRLSADSSWHGLAVSGVIAAQTDNFQGVAGIDFAARLLPVRVLGKCGGFISDIIDAMRWSVGLSVAGVPDNPNPAHVLNLSLTGSGACSKEEQRAINAAVDAGTLVVVAAGNNETDTANQSPANCRNVVVVGAVARDGKLASYVNTGSEVDLAAPGGDGDDGILTLFNLGATSPGADGLASIQGTSFTAAQVSAVAALMLATDDSLTPATVEELLRRSARTFSADSNCGPCSCGAGILDARAALEAAADPAQALSAEFTAPDCATRVDSGDSGGGCVLNRVQDFDPVLLIILLVASFRAIMRR